MSRGFTGFQGSGPLSDQPRSNVPLTKARRVVVKIGSSLLVDMGTGELNRPWLDALVEDISRLRSRRQEVLVVSSGAIALGRRHLRMHTGKLKLEESQAAAAAGQIRLAHAFEDALRKQSTPVAQVLLTLEDTEQRQRYLNARSTLTMLLRLGALPVINENDTVATTEIRYGDNDRLAARVAQMMSADCLILLSDVEGFYTGDPLKKPDSEFIERVTEITPEIEAMAGSAASDVGTGGMMTKIAAAKIAVKAGCHVLIASGKVMHPIDAIENGGRTTCFVPHETPVAARKQWIAGTLSPNGTLTIDKGAERALKQGKSLLPAGVIKVEGAFQRGDAVTVKSMDGYRLGRGLSAYSSEEAACIMGRQTSEIEALIGYEGRDEIIHRDDLVMDS